MYGRTTPKRRKVLLSKPIQNRQIHTYEITVTKHPKSAVLNILLVFKTTISFNYLKNNKLFWPAVVYRTSAAICLSQIVKTNFTHQKINLKNTELLNITEKCIKNVWLSIHIQSKSKVYQRWPLDCISRCMCVCLNFSLARFN